MSVDPPRPRGPHLNAMRCFEASARLGGFAAAAEELCVTAGAVSQQVKALEDWVGAALFERRSQGVSLTALGAQVQDGFTDAFDALGLALHDLRHAAPAGPVNIAALPSVAQLWLSPRLSAVRRAMPGRVISVTATEKPPNLTREVFDFSVFIGTPSGAETQVVLAQDSIFPVCAPELAGQLHHPADLAGVTLIHDASWIEDWPRWLRHVGLADLPLSGPSFSLYSIAVDEACNGAGVLMGHAPLVARHLASGALVAPFDGALNTDNALIAALPNRAARAGPAGQILDILAAQ